MYIYDCIATTNNSNTILLTLQLFGLFSTFPIANLVLALPPKHPAGWLRPCTPHALGLRTLASLVNVWIRFAKISSRFFGKSGSKTHHPNLKYPEQWEPARQNKLIWDLENCCKFWRFSQKWKKFRNCWIFSKSL